MRVFLDTNILLSAALFPEGVAAAAYDRAVSAPNDAVVSGYVVDELRSVFARKFSRKAAAMDAFLARLAGAAEIVLTPEEAYADEEGVRDPADRPILRAARHAKAEVLLTGDKDLLEAGIDSPRVIAPRDFLDLLA